MYICNLLLHLHLHFECYYYNCYCIPFQSNIHATHNLTQASIQLSYRTIKKICINCKFCWQRKKKKKNKKEEEEEKTDWVRISLIESLTKKVFLHRLYDYQQKITLLLLALPVSLFKHAHSNVGFLVQSHGAACAVLQQKRTIFFFKVYVFYVKKNFQSFIHKTANIAIGHYNGSIP